MVDVWTAINRGVNRPSMLPGKCLEIIHLPDLGWPSSLKLCFYSLWYLYYEDTFWTSSGVHFLASRVYFPLVWWRGEIYSANVGCYICYACGVTWRHCQTAAASNYICSCPLWVILLQTIFKTGFSHPHPKYIKRHKYLNRQSPSYPPKEGRDRGEALGKEGSTK